MLNMKGMRFPLEGILVCIRWYAAYSLSTQNLEEMMEERGVLVDHLTVSRRAIRFLPLLKKVFRKYKRAVDASWWMDETYVQVNGMPKKSRWTRAAPTRRPWTRSMTAWEARSRCGRSST